MSRRFRAALLTATVVTVQASAQEFEFPAPHSPVSGIVVDEHGDPVRGARVALAASTDPDREFSRAIAQCLRRTPLPQTVSDTEGEFRLALTSDQRLLRSPSSTRTDAAPSTFWLIVEHDGFLPWREPLGHDLSLYLGSRVVLRAVRADDPFARIPWPPVVAEPEQPWQPIHERIEPPACSARGPALPAGTRRAEAKTRLVFTRPNGTPARSARLLFSNSSYGAGVVALPKRLDANGSVSFEAPGGHHSVQVLVEGFLPTIHSFLASTAIDEPQEFVLAHARTFDACAIDAHGDRVPFADCWVTRETEDFNSWTSLRIRADSLGRIRFRMMHGLHDVFVQTGAHANDRVELHPETVTKVEMRRPVTILLRVDERPIEGRIRRESNDGVETGFFRDRSRALRAHSRSEWVVTRVFERGLERAIVFGAAKPPMIVRRTDLPPATSEPLLDLAMLDRRLRLRAHLDIKTANGQRALKFALHPLGLPVPHRRQEDARLSRRSRERREWECWARDDDGYELLAIAHRFREVRIRLEPTANGARVPTLTIPFEPQEH